MSYCGLLGKAPWCACLPCRFRYFLCVIFGHRWKNNPRWCSRCHWNREELFRKYKDVVAQGFTNVSGLPCYTFKTRPNASSVPFDFKIFNLDDEDINVSDGINWRDIDGVIT